MWAAPHLQAHFPKSALAAPALLGSSLPKALGEHGPWCSPAVLIKEVVHSHSSNEALGPGAWLLQPPAGSFACHLLEHCCLFQK